MAYTDNITALNAVTSTTTSSVYDISMRSNISLVFLAASISSGNGVFTVDMSNDGTNWVTGIAMIDATSATATTYVTSKTLSSNTTAGVYLPNSGFRLMRVKVTRTTDGAYSAFLQLYGGE